MSLPEGAGNFGLSFHKVNFGKNLVLAVPAKVLVVVVFAVVNLLGSLRVVVKAGGWLLIIVLFHV